MAGFFDVFQDTAPEGGVFIGKDEKVELKDAGAVFEVQSIISEENPFNGNERYVLSVLVNDQDRKLSFDIGTGVDSRDRMLRNMEKYLEDETNEKPKVVLGKVGRAWIIKQA